MSICFILFQTWEFLFIHSFRKIYLPTKLTKTKTRALQQTEWPFILSVPLRKVWIYLHDFVRQYKFSDSYLMILPWYKSRDLEHNRVMKLVLLQDSPGWDKLIRKKHNAIMVFKSLHNLSPVYSNKIFRKFNAYYDLRNSASYKLAWSKPRT